MAASDFSTRLASAAVLAFVALAGAWLGGWPAILVTVAAVVVVHLEWAHVTEASRAADSLPYTAAVVLSVLLAGTGRMAMSFAVVAIAALVAAILGRNAWRPVGVVYAALFGISLLAIRLAPDHGLFAIVFLFAVVWATDTGAYSAGRLIGGPKLWPAVSPKKTWSGAVGGLVAALAAAAVATALVAEVRLTVALAIVALGLSLASQAGDLFESSVKRRFGVKDSGNLIPGHGGLMDRVDGLIFASCLAALIGWVHGGTELARGLLVW